MIRLAPQRIPAGRRVRQPSGPECSRAGAFRISGAAMTPVQTKEEAIAALDQAMQEKPVLGAILAPVRAYLSEPAKPAAPVTVPAKGRRGR